MRPGSTEYCQSTTVTYFGRSGAPTAGAGERLLAPEGQLQKHRLEVQQLASQAVHNVALLDAMKKEQGTLDELRERLRTAQNEVKSSASTARSLKADFDRLRSLTGQLTQEHARLKESVRETHAQAATTTAAVRDVDKKLGPLNEMLELSKTTETRLATLNSLAAHVLQKVKVLENQKHTVEHAVVEANRLNEMVWNMDVQVVKLKDGAQQAAQVEETVHRIELLANDTGAQLDQVTTSQASFTRELDRLERGRAEVTTFIHGYVERLAIERKEIDSCDERLDSLRTGLSTIETTINTLQARQKDLGTLGQRTEGLEKQFVDLTGQADELRKKQMELDTLRDSLVQVDELTKRTRYQFGALEKNRTDLEGMRTEIQVFYKTHGEVSKTIASLSADKTTFEGFLRRTDDFRRQIPVLDSKMDAITSKLSVVEAGTQKAATLVAVAEDLDRQMNRFAGHQQLVEKIEARLRALNTLSTNVDTQMQDQLSRRAELDALKSLCDGLSIQVTEARHKIDGINATQHKLLPLTTKIAELRHQVDKTESAFLEIKQDETAIAEQEKRLSELVDQSREVADDVEARALQVQALSTALGASTATKDELSDELSQVQTRQHEVTTQIQLSEDQLKRVEQQTRQLDERRHNSPSPTGSWRRSRTGLATWPRWQRRSSGRRRRSRPDRDSSARSRPRSKRCNRSAHAAGPTSSTLPNTALR